MKDLRNCLNIWLLFNALLAFAVANAANSPLSCVSETEAIQLSSGLVCKEYRVSSPFKLRTVFGITPKHGLAD